MIIEKFEEIKQFSSFLTLNKRIFQIIKSKKERVMKMKMKRMENSFCQTKEKTILGEFISHIPFSSLSLVYCASSNGFGAIDFHKYCDGKKKLVVLIKANNFIFGKENLKNIFFFFYKIRRIFF